MKTLHLKLFEHKEEIKQIKKRMNRDLLKKNSKVIRLMNLAIIIMVIFNFGALLMTNILVVKKAPDMELREANPQAAEIGNFELHPDHQALINQLFFQSCYWAVAIFIYVLTKKYIRTELGLHILEFIVLFYFILIGLDFTNDLGYTIGKAIFSTIP